MWKLKPKVPPPTQIKTKAVIRSSPMWKLKSEVPPPSQAETKLMIRSNPNNNLANIALTVLLGCVIYTQAKNAWELRKQLDTEGFFANMVVRVHCKSSETKMKQTLWPWGSQALHSDLSVLHASSFGILQWGNIEWGSPGCTRGAALVTEVEDFTQS